MNYIISKIKINNNKLILILKYTDIPLKEKEVQEHLD